MAKTLAERLRDCAQGLSLGADGMGWSPDPELLKQAADKIDGLHAELQYARGGLTNGRTRMREDNERLAEALSDLLAAHAMRASCQAGLMKRCKCMPCATARARDVLGPNDQLRG